MVQCQKKAEMRAECDDGPTMMVMDTSTTMTQTVS